MEDVLEEAHWLAEHHVTELVVIAQDTTRYGCDLYGKSRLPELLRELCHIDGIRWVTKCVESADKGGVWVDFK